MNGGRRQRIAIASPDPALAARVTHVLSEAGHEVALVTDSPFDAMEAAFSRGIDILVVDQVLDRLSGSEVARMVASGESAASVILLRGTEPGPAGEAGVLDPDRPDFDAELTTAIDRTVQARSRPGA